jgi:formylglycine-generating enzyme required for sulfatase activity
VTFAFASTSRPAVVAIVLGWLGSACVVSFDGYELDASSGGAGATSTSTSSAGAASSTSTNAGAGGSGADGGAGSGGDPMVGGGGSSSGGAGGSGGVPVSCPSEGGPMISVAVGGDAYCIDATEVTQASYQGFLAAGPDPTMQIPACTGNSSFTPSCTFDPVPEPNQPVVCVDWCDAIAFCTFVGKRLCGKIGGGSSTVAAASDPAQSQWYRACSEAGARLYPYGNLYQPDTCNGLDSPFTGTANVALLAQCNGGYQGLYDMSGNTREWEDACDGNNCLQRGGGWLDSDTSSPHSLRCDSDGVASRSQSSDQVGFRCCADP